MPKKLTIIKVLPRDQEFGPTQEDLERWTKIFTENQMTVEEAVATGEVEVQTLPEKVPGEHYITLVKVGDETYKPSMEDLTYWRDMFKEGMGDPDFKVFTHPSVEIDLINIGEIVAVE